jgi:hypothetical protein
MENKNILLIFAMIIIVLLIAGGAMIYSQQKSIDKLNALAVSGNNSKALLGGAGSKNPAAAVDAGKAKAMETGNYIVGKITQISGNDLTVEADMIDWDKMKEFVSSQAKSADYGKKPPTVKKTYSVSANGETEYIMNQLKDLRVGDGIWVTAREQVYQTDKITAAQIASPYNASNSATPVK